MVQEKSVQEVGKLMVDGKSIALIDVRTPAEFAAVHAIGARNIPLDKVTLEECSKGCDASQPIYVICQGGRRSRTACEQLIKAGHQNVVSVIGGTKAWVGAGLPVIRGAGVISLERQVRIAAGTLVLIGLIFSSLIAPWFVWLSAFVGAGLVFSGVTDTCGMGLVLARMPWNKRALTPLQ